MRTRLRHWKAELSSSLWPIPLLVVLAFIGLSRATLTFDARYVEGVGNREFLFSGGPEGASAVLSAIAGSMIGVVGVTFSITIVTLTLASSQFGPRLLRAFMRDKPNQVFLGVLMGTFAFSILALRAVDRPAGAEGVPEITVNVAIGLALVSLGVLIYFLHHVAHGIQADTVIASVAQDMHESIDLLYPDEMGQAVPREEHARGAERIERADIPLRAPRAGYVQAIDEDAFLKTLAEGDLVAQLLVRPGDFVAQGQPLARVGPAGAALDERLAALRQTCLVGRRRTAEQDVEFSIAQLVEVGVRALSPGINDPFTAIRCIERLSSGLCHLAQRRIPSRDRADANGVFRVRVRATTWEGAVDAALAQLRQNARANVAVTIALLESIERVEACLPRGDVRLAALQRHRDDIAWALESADFTPADLRDVQRRLARVAPTPTAEALRDRPGSA